MLNSEVLCSKYNAQLFNVTKYLKVEVDTSGVMIRKGNAVRELEFLYQNLCSYIYRCGEHQFIQISLKNIFQ